MRAEKCQRARVGGVHHRTHLDTELLHRLRREKSPDLRRDGAVETADDNLVALVQHTVRQDNVDGGAESLDDLDLEHGALEGGKVHEALRHAFLR